MVKDTLRPGGLRDRGSALWDALVTSDTSTPDAVLAGEACRLADRLDQLDQLLAGDIDTWVTLTHRLMTEDYELKIDGAAAEARQAAAALRQILTKLTASDAAAPSGGSIADELAARRAEREADATG
ncbi:hypothetical protein [Williamsia sp.]|uniref:hypothetical protein n=1 Tax=Williamsia sp. TaxID=1872085 RepID=UPI002F93D932